MDNMISVLMASGSAVSFCPGTEARAFVFLDPATQKPGLYVSIEKYTYCRHSLSLLDFGPLPEEVVASGRLNGQVAPLPRVDKPHDDDFESFRGNPGFVAALQLLQAFEGEKVLQVLPAGNLREGKANVHAELKLGSFLLQGSGWVSAKFFREPLAA